MYLMKVQGQLKNLLVHSGNYNKNYHKLSGLYQKRLFVTVVEVAKSKIMVPVDTCERLASSLTASHCNLARWKGRGVFLASFVRALIPFTRIHLLKPPPSNTITWGARSSMQEFWGDTNIQNIAESLTLTIESWWCNCLLGVSHKQGCRCLAFSVIRKTWTVTQFLVFEIQKHIEDSSEVHMFLPRPEKNFP